jgi:CheY-like chemotaxis protein
MPKMDGFRVAECIRATELSWSNSVAKSSHQGKIKAKHQCPIIALTAHHSNEVVVKAKSAGINKVLRKPANMSDIINLLKEYYY